MRFQINNKTKAFAPAAMADIAFLLLIFLILTVTAGDEPEVELPGFRYSEKTGFEITLAVEILKNGNVVVNGEPAEKENFGSVLAQYEKGMVVHVFADRETDYSTVDQVLNILRDNELYRIILVADKSNDEEG
jgi:biopolymer transport protein ExbD